MRNRRNSLRDRLKMAGSPVSQSVLAIPAPSGMIVPPEGAKGAFRVGPDDDHTRRIVTMAV
jgi:hypothetical protein